MKTQLTKTEKKIAAEYGNSILYKSTTIRPTRTTGSGRWTKNSRSHTAMSQIEKLQASGLFHYETGNDAPRGGACGEYHMFTPIKRRLALKKADELKAAEAKAVAVAAAEAKAKAAAEAVEEFKNSIATRKAEIAEDIARLDSIKATGVQADWQKVANQTVQKYGHNVLPIIGWREVYSQVRQSIK